MRTKRIGFRGAVVLLILATVCEISQALAEVVINEVLAANLFSNADEEGNFSDWIELFNQGSEAISLTGFHLSDDPQKLDMWRFPDVVIRADGHLLVWCSGRDRYVPPPELVAADSL